MTRNPAIVFIFAILGAGFSLSAASQTSAELNDYFRDSIGLSQEQIAIIGNGKAVAKVLKSRTPAEIFVFGAVHIKASPESYVQLAGDFDRLQRLPEFLAIGKFGNPQRASRATFGLVGSFLVHFPIKFSRRRRPIDGLMNVFDGFGGHLDVTITGLAFL